jgi:hypothetical protein
VRTLASSIKRRPCSYALSTATLLALRSDRNEIEPAGRLARGLLEASQTSMGSPLQVSLRWISDVRAMPAYTSTPRRRRWCRAVNESAGTNLVPTLLTGANLRAAHWGRYANDCSPEPLSAIVIQLIPYAPEIRHG